MLRSSIKLICKSIGVPDMDEVASGANLLVQLRKEKYTHLILDLWLADGDALELLEIIRKEYPALQVMVFSSQPASLYGPSLKKKYGCKYISKVESDVDTIRQLADFLKDGNPSSPPEPVKRHNPFMLLSEQERDVALYWFMGWRTDQMAEKLAIKSSSVRSVKRRILEKTGAEDLEALKEMANKQPKA